MLACGSSIDAWACSRNRVSYAAAWCELRRIDAVLDDAEFL
jgi:hypothetical protein